MDPCFHGHMARTKGSISNAEKGSRANGNTYRAAYKSALFDAEVKEIRKEEGHEMRRMANKLFDLAREMEDLDRMIEKRANEAAIQLGVKREREESASFGSSSTRDATVLKFSQIADFAIYVRDNANLAMKNARISHVNDDYRLHALSSSEDEDEEEGAVLDDGSEHEYEEPEIDHHDAMREEEGEAEDGYTSDE